MAMELLFANLEAIYPLSLELKAHLLTTIKYRELPKRTYLLKAGQISREVCFVEKGLLRCFYEKGELEVSAWFMKERDVIFSIESFYSQTPSYESIQALEDTSLFYISFDELEYIYGHFSEFNIIGRKLTTHYHTLWVRQLYNIRMTGAPERYHWLLDNHAELIQRVPAKYLASYLDISETTLSKIKGMKMR
jgi:CRP-like cAMP-binding protein